MNDTPNSNSDNGRSILSALLVETISASYTRRKGEKSEAFEKFRTTFNQIFEDQTQLPDSDHIRSLHLQLAQTDLDRLGFRARIQASKAMPANDFSESWSGLIETLPRFDILTNLKCLLDALPSPETPSGWGLFFSTRPLGVIEINLLDPRTQQDTSILCEWLRCIRGNRFTAYDNNTENDNEVVVNDDRAPEKPRVAITSYKTPVQYWVNRVRGTPVLTLERFKFLLNLIRESCQLNPRPNYLVFPELSVPHEWVIEIASALQRSGISMIAGVEYEIPGVASQRLCHNQAILILRSTDLGYQTFRLIRQDKTIPALDEERELLEMSQLTLVPKEPFDFGYQSDTEKGRPIYRHGQFRFGVLICNELTNISFRQKFRGEIDALFVLEWNKDTKTFASLVEAAASDVHCFVVQVNNRSYGDSRIRVPAKHEWERDTVRLQGGINDYVVVGEIDFMKLRVFQSYHRSPTGSDAHFKPVPTGFKISSARSVNKILTEE